MSKERIVDQTLSIPAIFKPLLAAAILASPAPAYAHQTSQTDLSKAPVPIAFEGGHALGVASARERILSQTLGYVLTVDASGNVSDCELNYDFRRQATTNAMCRPFLRHMSFEPALDDKGNPTVGTYAFVIDFNMFITQDGYLEERFR